MMEKLVLILLYSEPSEIDTIEIGDAIYKQCPLVIL